MIEAMMKLGADTILIRVVGTEVFFANTAYGAQLAPIDGLRLDHQGVCREFPDLEGDLQWRTRAIERFKDKIKSLKTESERIDFIIADLKKYGYSPMYKQRSGFRREVLQ